jgi:hypothetical protein
LAIINELQIKESTGYAKDMSISSSLKTATLCKLAQATPELWIALCLEANTWLLNERKHQQQGVDELKTSNKDTAKVCDKERISSSNF